MACPALQFTNDLEAVFGAVGFGRVTGELFIGQIGIIFKSTGRLDDIYLFCAITLCEFSPQVAASIVAVKYTYLAWRWLP